MSIPRFPDGACLAIDVASDPSATTGVLFANPASINTKSTYTQLVASTANDIDLLVLGMNLNTYGDGGIAMSLDLAIGAAASEMVIVKDIVLGWPNSYMYQQIAFPLSIPAGTRIAARVMAGSNNGTTRVGVNIQGYASNVAGYAGVDALGFVTASTKGTAIAPSATTNTKGSYAQLIASTARDYSGIFFSVDPTSNYPGRRYLFDLAIGGAGSEVVIIPNVLVSYDVANGSSSPMSEFVPIQIPAGTRVAARCQAGGASSVTLQLTAYGVY